MDEKTIKIGKEDVPVNQEVHTEYYYSARRMQYYEHDIKTPKIKIVGENLVYFPVKEDSFDLLIEIGVQFASREESVEELVIKNIMLEKLKECLSTLSENEIQIISEIFYNRKSERQLAKMIGIPQKTINDSKKKILQKFKILLEN